MEEDEGVGGALFKFGGEKLGSILDSGNTGDSFWGIIEGRYYDQSVLVRFSFTGHVKGADPSVPPLYH